MLGDLPKATEAYTQLMTNYPRVGRVRNILGTLYANQGQYEQAAEMVRSAIAERPDINVYFGNMANYLMAQQRLDEAREMIAQIHARKLDDFVLRLALYGLDFLKADEAGMNGQLQWFADRPEAAFYGFSIASDTAAYSGRLQQGRELTMRAADAATRADSKEYAGINMEVAAIREAAYGNRAQGLQDAAAGLKFDAESQAVRAMAGIALAMGGDAARANALVEELNRQFPADTQMQSLWLPAIRAQMALERKNPSAAIDELRAALPAIEYGQIALRLEHVLSVPHVYPGAGLSGRGARNGGRDRVSEDPGPQRDCLELLDGSAGAPWHCPGECARSTQASGRGCRHSAPPVAGRLQGLPHPVERR